MRILIFITILHFISPNCMAQADSLSFSIKREPVRLNKITSSKAFQISVIPVLLTSTGLAYMSFNNQFNSLRGNFTPNFHHKYDDYTQYLPAAVMLGLKAGGVKSQSSWSKMLTADVFSIALMSGVTNGLKYVTNVRRPDGGGYNSFPSGHTATAFMTATMLHKEYGHLSPWYSIGGYTAASVTGVTRILNNRHWMGDVFVGAAIGIISVELGYVLADLIFKKEQETSFKSSNLQVGKNHHPTFISFYTGITQHFGKHSSSHGDKVTIDIGSRAGVEGAWFINPYIGIGGQFIAATSPINTDKDQTQSALNTLSLSTGVYVSYPLSSVFRLGTKALIGTNFVYKPKSLPSFLNIKDTNLNLQTGLSISYLAKRNLGFKLFSDYNFRPSYINNKASNELTLGVSIDLMF